MYLKIPCARAMQTTGCCPPQRSHAHTTRHADIGFEAHVFAYQYQVVGSVGVGRVRFCGVVRVLSHAVHIFRREN